MIGVVLIDYNSYTRTIQYIEDILQYSDINIDGITIIDNSPSKDNYYELLKGLNNKSFQREKEIQREDCDAYLIGRILQTKIIIVKTKENLGFARANNLGYKILKESIDIEYVLFSNSDIIFDNHSLKLSQLVDSFKIEENIGLVGPLVVGVNGKQQSPCKYLSIYSRWWKPTLLWPFNKMLKSREQVYISKPDSVYRIIGAFMLAKCDGFEKIGGFDENTFLYGEECILSEKYKSIGLKVFCNPNVKIIHEGGYTTNTSKKDYKTRDKKIKRRLESDLYYYKKYIHVSKFIINLTYLFTLFYLFKLHIKDFIKK